MTGNRFEQLAREFPDYPLADLPDIPADWTDSSWHNDACPSFIAPNLVRVFLDWADPAKSDFFDIRGDGFARFSASAPDTERGHGNELACSDDWAEILAAVANYTSDSDECRASGHRDTGRGVCAVCGVFL